MAYQQGCDVRGCSTFELMTTVTLWIEHLEYKIVRPDKMQSGFEMTQKLVNVIENHWDENRNKMNRWWFHGQKGRD